MNIRFGHCTSCLFDNSSVKLCKARHAVPFVPQSTNDEQGLGQVRPNKITSKLARVADVKSRWSTTFSRIENLWPRDGSCPLPLRSKPFLGNCFRIVKTQKISRGCAAHVCGSPFAPNEVPAPVCAAALTKSRYHVRSAHEIFKVQLPKRKIPPTQHSDGFCRVNRRQNESGVLRGGKFFRGLSLTEVVGLTVITNHFCRRFAINLQVQWDL